MTANTFTAVKSSIIKAPASEVWEALTDPQQVKQYMLGTTLKADWRVGGDITYSGEWQGKPYKDRGKVLAFQPKKLLKTTYYSPLSGKKDVPENYQTVTYELTEGDGQTTLTVTQDNNTTQEEADKAAANWGIILDNLRGALEAP